MRQTWSVSASSIPTNSILNRTTVSKFAPTEIHQRFYLGNARVYHRCSATPGRPFSDFIEQEEGGDKSGVQDSDKSPEEKAQELIERTTAILQRAQAALDDVRRREPSDSRHRRTGGDITTGPTLKTTSSNSTPTSISNGKGGGKSAPVKPTITSLPLAWASDSDDEYEEDEDEDSNSLSFLKKKASPSSGSGGGGGGAAAFGGSSGGGGSGSSGSSNVAPGGLDSWFGDKIDTGKLDLRPSAVTPTRAGVKPSTTGPAVAVLDRPDMPSSFDFAAPESPAESGGASIFPEGLAMRFQSETEIPKSTAAATPAPAVNDKVTWERTTGEEFGDNGYWYRWTEIQGKDESGTVQWSERWWEVSDWKGMKELGAEKWGSNDRGDAWRESWRESIGFDAATGQPMVERTAHKWARAGTAREWEEKWGESYLSGGKAEKYADKWAREGTDTWHEKWGENYDGEGGCVKYTDRWAERPPGGYDAGGNLDKWGEKWEEVFKDGRGTKRGETWSESAMGDRYQRWWGENHEGGGVVQKFGHSNTGEHWDVTEHMDTYYNPIPHFGYDLALAHSPILREVPTLPRDSQLDGDKGGDGGGGKGGGGGGDLGGIFG